ncbi:MAG TPA: nucleotidyltransferase family protein [Candidatus Polarisedimenticolaceae bacterium]|nr:nucleotidyltransferase family protein [Candidatus Polarisedimenticolaceae bacterium]
MDDDRAVAAIVLAAGGARRFGSSKALARLGGRELIRIAVDAAIGGGCRPIVVVLGAEAAAVARALDGLSVLRVIHRGWRRGVASSIRAGLAEVERSNPHAPAVLLVGIDQPLIDAELVGRLLAASEGGSRPAAAAYADTIGIPAVVPRERFAALRRLTGEGGAKRTLLAAGPRLARVDWPDGAHDVDRREDLARLAPTRRRPGR